MQRSFVREHLTPEVIPGDTPNKPDKPPRVSKRRDKIIDEFGNYAAEQGLNDMASVAAAKALELFLAKNKLTIGPDRPPELPTPPSTPATPQPEEGSGSASSSPPLPTKPPARWPADRLPKESAPDFIKRVYAPWLGSLRRSDIAGLDRALYKGLRNWLLRHGNRMPEDVPLPSQMEQSSALVDAVFKGDTVTVTISHPDPAERAKAIRRLGEKLRYVEKKGSPER